MRIRIGGRPTFWIALVVGWAVIGIGIRGALDEHVLTHPAALMRWIGGGLIVHDGVWVPLTLLVGAALARLVRGPARGPLLWATATAAVFVAVAWPFVRGYGRKPDNPSLLPRNYATGLFVYLAVIAVIAAAWWLIATLRKE